MNTRVRKAVKKAGKLATKATRKASALSNNASKSATAVTIAAAQTVSSLIKRQQRKRKMAKVAKAAKQVGAGLVAAAAVTGAAIAVNNARKPKKRFR
jgi:hypothetical protein